MSPRALGAIAIAAILGGLAWFALRHRDEPASSNTVPRAGSDRLTASRPQPSSASAQTPQLPTEAPALAVVPPLSPEATFAAEPRDDDWAAKTEGEIRARFKTVRGAKLEATECRESHCRIVVAGSQADLGRTIADLEGDRGLHGYADHIVLTAPDKRADGTLAMRAIVVFKR